MAEVGIVDSGRDVHVDDRVLGRVRGQRRGATLMCVAGLHGNEPAGVHAVRRVLVELEDRVSEMTGDFVALAGNLAALAQRRRFIDRDLNRAWTESRIRALGESGDECASAEDLEQVELLGEVDRVLEETRGTVYALDLHTTSGPGGIFSAFIDSLPQRAFASHFPVPMIFGLEELVDGTLLNLLSDLGMISITVETGQHDEPAAIDRAEAAIWIAVVASGVLPEGAVPEVDEARKMLQNATVKVPRALEMRYRRDVVAGDGFKMEPGYSNFQEVVEGQVIARDNEGFVVASEDSRLLMPLYQEQGEDGYFLVKEFHPFWMLVSHLLRRVDAARVAPWLPGVRVVEGSDDEVVVDERVAGFFARRLFHLLGYRRIEEVGSELMMRRRRFQEGKYRSRVATSADSTTSAGTEP